MTHKVLFFECDEAFASSVGEMLGKYQVDYRVAGGREGLALAEEFIPDLIMLSIELVTMNGFLVCKKIKKSATLQKVPLVILSTDPNADEIFAKHKTLKTRADEYLRKPMPMPDLEARLRTLVAFVPKAAAASPAPTATVQDGANADIDAFAENAFGSMLSDSEPAEMSDDHIDVEATNVLSGDHMAPLVQPAATAQPLVSPSSIPSDGDSSALQTQLAAKVKESDELRAQLERVSSELEAARQDAERRRRGDADSTRELEALRTEVDRLKRGAGDHESLAMEMEQLKGRLAQEQSKVAELDTALGEQRKKHASSDAERASMDEAHQRELNELARKLAAAEGALEAKEAGAGQLESTILSLEATKTEMQELLQTSRTGEQKARDELAGLGAQFSQVQAQLMQCEGARDEATARIREMEAERESLRAELGELEKTKAALTAAEAQVAGLTQQVGEYVQRFAVTESELGQAKEKAQKLEAESEQLGAKLREVEETTRSEKMQLETRVELIEEEHAELIEWQKNTGVAHEQLKRALGIAAALVADINGK